MRHNPTALPPTILAFFRTFARSVLSEMSLTPHTDAPVSLAARPGQLLKMASRIAQEEGKFFGPAMKIKGSIVALATPLRENTVDLKALQSLIAWHSEEGTEGLVIAGSTGEGSLLSAEERQMVFRAAVDANRATFRPLLLIAGCGAYSTTMTIESVQQAEACGVDAIMVVSPSYIRPSQRGAFLHFQAVARATRLPLILYNHPGRTGFALQNDTIVDLASACPNIVALKDSCPDLSRIADLRRRLPRSFTLLSGDDATNIGFLAQGGEGIISVTGNIFPKFNEKFIKFWDNGEVRKAFELHEALMPVHKVLFCEPNPSPVIYALSQMRGIANEVRLPLLSIEAGSEAARRIENAIAEGMKLREDFVE